MNKNWQGKAVSIQCIESLGVLQGTIKEVYPSKITIVRAFRNGLPLRTLDTEFTIMATDIIKLELIPSINTDVVTNGNGNNGGTNHKQSNGESSLSSKLKDVKINKLSRSPPNTQRQQPKQQQQLQTYNVQKSFANMIPAKVEVRMAASAPNVISYMTASAIKTEEHQRNPSKPIDIIQMPASKNAILSNNNSITPSSTPYKNDRRQQRATQNRRPNAYNNQAFGSPVDELVMYEEFDFEKNLALFDKQAVFSEIDANHKPDLLRQTQSATKKNYRHNENVLTTSKPTVARQIITNRPCTMEFATDDDIIIPTVPLQLRHAIERRADAEGLSWHRQCDMLARGTAEMGLCVLGGARRFTPKNQHQWPTVGIVCDMAPYDRISEVGIATARQLASQGLKTIVFIGRDLYTDRRCVELALFRASGNNVTVTNLASELPVCDLVILAVGSHLPLDVTKWINDNRKAITLAIDPPLHGLPDVIIKYSIVPTLPVEGISTACGKLYLCNLGIPEKYYSDAGIRYKSPFGHKFLIPIHLQSG